MIIKSALSALFALVAFTAASAQSSQLSFGLSPDAAAKQCLALTGKDMGAVQDAPTHIIQGAWTPAAGAAPAYCDVKGYVTPNVGFSIKLPLNWNGKMFMAGNGGYAGSTEYSERLRNNPSCMPATSRGYACLQTDTGHTSTGVDAKWAYNNLQAEVDYGSRSVHVANLAGKAVLAAYYGRAAEKSYFQGCSYGGEQALTLAQRFPYDFDGIIAEGAPISLSRLMQQNIWMMRHTLDKDWNSIFSEADIQLLRKNALAQCDMDDGLKDGVIGNPGACRIDTSKLVCKAGQSSGCMSKANAEAAQKAYDGPTTSTGKRLSLGGWMPGSELDWINVYKSPLLANLAQEYFRFMGFSPDPGPTWLQTSYDFDKDYKRLGMMEAIYATSNPDLRELQSAGAKMMLISGWNDMGMMAPQLIDYYEAAQRVVGSEAETKDFFRMFLLPAVRHCGFGEGAYNVDFLSYMENWVEKGVTPDVMIGTHPADSTGPTFTRPHYAYPKRAAYKGTGDPNDAANFKPVDHK